MPRPPTGSTKLARALRDDVRAITSAFSSPIRWIMVHELGLRHPDESEEAIDAAVELAIPKGWLKGDGSTPLHSVCLAREGFGSPAP